MQHQTTTGFYTFVVVGHLLMIRWSKADKYVGHTRRNRKVKWGLWIGDQFCRRHFYLN